MWPELTALRFLEVLRTRGWTTLIVEDRCFAAQTQDAVLIQFNFGPDDTLDPEQVAYWAERLNIPQEAL